MTKRTTPEAGPARERAQGWLWAFGLILATMALHTINLDHLPHHDELYHLLAAKGMLATGEPQIAEGIYERAIVHTWLVAKSLSIFGESFAAARVPSLIAIGLLVGALFLFLHREAGPLAAWIGAVLFALSPFAIELAQFARFYAPQSLLFFLAAIAVHDVVFRSSGSWRRTVLGIAAVAAIALATHFQETTLIGVAGLGLWLTCVLSLRYLERPGARASHVVLLLAGLAITGLALLLATGLLGDLWTLYRWTEKFNAAGADKFWYYHAWLSLYYPSLWPVIGIVSLAGIAAFPRPGLLFLAVFATGFLLSSFGAAKGMRYLAYAIPFLFGLWGLGLAAVVPPLRRFLTDLAGRITAAFGATEALPEPWPRRLSTTLLTGGLLFLLLANPAGLRSFALLADITIPPEEPDIDWEAAVPALRDLAEQADILVTTDDLGAELHLGRYDVLLNPSKLGELPDEERHDLGLDPRTGRPVIGSSEAMEKLLTCNDTGLLIAWAKHWGRGHLRLPEIEALATAHMEPIDLPRRSRLVAFHWRKPAEDHSPDACTPLPGQVRGRG